MVHPDGVFAASASREDDADLARALRDVRIEGGLGYFMRVHEETLRRDCLGSFRQLLIDMTKDNAMLNWLDNNGNSGADTDADGIPVPPNENYGRELMQLFSLGTQRLNMDRTPVLDPDREPLPNYTEDDVKAAARALTGFFADDASAGNRRSLSISTTPGTRFCSVT